jgi:RNA polymerase sigma-70 factor (ECF subfamily)
MQRYADILLRVAYGYLKSSTDAEDILQDIFLATWQGRATWQPQGSIVSYFMVAVRRRALNVLKHRRVERHYEERVTHEAANDMSMISCAAADLSLMAQDDRTAAWKLLDRLSAQARMVLLLRYGQQMSFAEVARAMGISAPAARQVAKRALDQLRCVYEI